MLLTEPFQHQHQNSTLKHSTNVNIINYIYIQPNALFLLFNRRRVDAGQNTRETPTVYHDSGVGANEKNHGTTAAQYA
jgi:hypothetical protein